MGQLLKILMLSPTPEILECSGAVGSFNCAVSEKIITEAWAVVSNLLWSKLGGGSDQLP